MCKAWRRSPQHRYQNRKHNINNHLHGNAVEAQHRLLHVSCLSGVNILQENQNKRLMLKVFLFKDKTKRLHLSNLNVSIHFVNPIFWKVWSLIWPIPVKFVLSPRGTSTMTSVMMSATGRIQHSRSQYPLSDPNPYVLFLTICVEEKKGR